MLNDDFSVIWYIVNTGMKNVISKTSLLVNIKTFQTGRYAHSTAESCHTHTIISE